jgi:hypothetical protein
MPWTVSAIFMATTLGVPPSHICPGRCSATADPCSRC